jgi:DNA-binding helix-hairpin-helix protein with protein kinase domain
MGAARLVDRTGNQISLGREIGRGGEGTVYELGRDTVAKVYHHPASPEKAAKLAAMVRSSSPKLRNVAAWPWTTLHTTPNGPVVGLVLPRIQQPVLILDLYSPAARATSFPEADWRFLIRAAANCACAMATLHEVGIVVGDVNQGNILVSAQATVNLIDCDSFQLRENGRLHRCEVGVPLYTPPELHGHDFKDVDRTTNHDCFGLAILVFQLLFMGRHPFSGCYSGTGEMPIEKAIEQYRFAYSSAAPSYQMRPPPQALTLDAVPLPIARFFERAFGRGSEAPGARPSARNWAESLTALEHEVAACSADPGHRFFSSLHSCPWCALIGGGAPNFFITVTIRAIRGKGFQFDLRTLWRKIEGVPEPRFDQLFPSRRELPHSIPKPLPPDAESSSQFSTLLGRAALIGAAASVTGIFIHVLLCFTLPVAICFWAWWQVVRFTSPLAKVTRNRRTVAREKRGELENAHQRVRAIGRQATNKFNELKGKYSQLAQDYQDLETRKNGELQRLQANAMNHQRNEYLRSQLICNATITGIGDSRKAQLASEGGIETALDIDAQRILMIHGFGEKITARLLVWRDSVEAEFRFDPSKGVPRSATDVIEIQFFQRRIPIEQELMQGPAALQRIAEQAKRDIQKQFMQFEALEAQSAQADADLRACMI